MYLIRKTKKEDLNYVDDIFAIAKKFMHENGNPTQWNTSYPNSKDVEIDISNGNAYVVLNGNELIATFACINGPDKTYKKIVDGNWLNDDDYVVIHRIATNGKYKHVFDEVVKFVEGFNVDIRIDTHKNNTPMIKSLQRNGFVECGIIYVADGSERLAYQKICKKY